MWSSSKPAVVPLLLSPPPASHAKVPEDCFYQWWPFPVSLMFVNIKFLKIVYQWLFFFSLVDVCQYKVPEDCLSMIVFFPVSLMLVNIQCSCLTCVQNIFLVIFFVDILPFLWYMSSTFIRWMHSDCESVPCRHKGWTGNELKKI